MRAKLKLDFQVDENGCFIVTSHSQMKRGYFSICVNGTRKYAHRHVYEECFGEITEKMVVCHKCDNKMCINPEHLELGTQQKNIQDAVTRGLKPLGSAHQFSKLKEHEVAEIKHRLIKGEKCVDIAKIFKINKYTISDIKRGKVWKHVVI